MFGLIGSRTSVATNKIFFMVTAERSSKYLPSISLKLLKTIIPDDCSKCLKNSVLKRKKIFCGILNNIPKLLKAWTTTKFSLLPITTNWTVVIFNDNVSGGAHGWKKSQIRKSGLNVVRMFEKLLLAISNGCIEFRKRWFGKIWH